MKKDPPINPSLNREAFLLGLYVALPAVDSIVEPLVQLSPQLSMPKVLLLDAALSLLGEYDVERSTFPSKGTMGRNRLGSVEQRRCQAVEFLYTTVRAKVGTIAGLLWDGQTELADWYRTGLAVGGLIEICDDTDWYPTPQLISNARNCLQQAASYWKRGLVPESGSGLDNWLTELGSRFVETGSSTTVPDSMTAGSSHGRLQQLRAVEGIATQIQDRQDDTRSEQQRLRDDRDRFIYENFHHGYDASEIVELVNKRIKEENLGWKKLIKGNDIRSIANQYANKFNKPQVPGGKPGRPSVKKQK